MSTKTKVIRTLRLAVLLTILGIVLLFFLRNRNFDPRFYRFLESKIGQSMASVLGWTDPFELPPLDKPESEFTDEELKVKRDLMKQVVVEMPTHELLLDTGEIMRGRIVGDNAANITFKEEYGRVGEMAVSIRRSRVKEVVELNEVPPAIHYRDVRFQMEFPTFRLYRRPPFTIVTDASFFRVQNSVRLLDRLHSDFMHLFEPLVTRPERGGSIQVLFFLDEDMYHEYQSRNAPNLENSSGFYTPALDRLVIFNQRSSGQLKAAKKRLRMQERAFLEVADTVEEQKRLELWLQDSERNIALYAEQQTELATRHEGAHQLFFTYGVHSTHHAENSWLVEGLAVFCEADRIGLREETRVSLLQKHRKADSLLPFRELLESRSPRGLFVFGKDTKVNLAYAQSWSVIHFLLQPKYRDAFFDYVRWLRNPDNVSAVAKESHVDRLAEYLRMTPEQFEELWLRYVERNL